MLNYLGYGKRRYLAQKRVFPYRRGFWEFQAVLRGRIGIWEDSKEHELQSNRIWLLHPEYKHGWYGAETEVAEVAVFHFAFIPSQLQSMIAESGFLSVGLDAASIRQIRSFLSTAKRTLREPDATSQLRFQSIQIGLSLIMLDHLEIEQLNPTASRARNCVNSALAYYRGHLDEAPDLESLAEKCNVSVSHLRRIFNQVTGTSPKEALDQVRFQIALELLQDPTSGLEHISEKTGFHSASAFSRAFKTRFGASPRTWRSLNIR